MFVQLLSWPAQRTHKIFCYLNEKEKFYSKLYSVEFETLSAIDTTIVTGGTKYLEENPK